MRDLLTGLAIILVVALTTALVAPYLVDWNSQRAFLEARLSHALGQKVTIGGAIDLKLLPTPYLVLDQTVIGADDAPLRVGIRHLDLVLSATPLLHGEFDIVQAQLRDPTLRITLNADRSLPSLPSAPAYAADLRFDRIEVDNGTIAVADPESGRTLVLDHLDMIADAPSLSGPFKGAGTEGPPQARTKFRFATTATQKGRTRAHLVVDATSTHAGLDVDGTLSLASAGAAMRPSFEGVATVTSEVPSGETAATWRLTGPVRADPERITLDNGELRLGTEDAGLSLQAAGALTFRDATHAALRLSADQLDIDRLSGPPGPTPRPPPRLPDAGTLERLVSAPAVPLDLTVDVKGATWGGEALSGLSGHLVLGGTGPRPLTLSGNGPGGSHLAVDGRLVPRGTSTGFDGTFEVLARDLPDAVGWLATIDPDLGLARADVPFETVRAQGTLASSEQGLVTTGLRLTLDRSVLTGSARYALSAEGRPAKLTCAVRADALDLDALPSLDALRRPARGLDLDLTLDAKAIKVSRFGDGQLDAGRLSLALVKSGSRLEVPRFRAENLGGATIAGTASLDADKATLAATIDAGKLEAAADLVRRLAPGRVADALVDRAPALAPAKLRIDAQFAADDKGTLQAAQLDLAGRLGATSVDAHLRPDAHTPGNLTLAASADAPEGAALLAQLGFHALPLDLVGHSRVTLAAQGRSGRPFATTIDGVFGGTHVVVDGSFDWLGAARGGSGTVALKSDDVAPILQSLAVAFPDMTGRLPVDLSAGVAVAQDGIALSDLKGTFAGLDTAGALKWRNAQGDAPALTGAIDLDRLSLGTLLGLALGPIQPQASDGTASGAPFSTGLVDPPRSAIRMRVRSFQLAPGQIAHGASFDLELAPNVTSVRGFKAELDHGHVGGDLTMRRDGTQATLDGKLAADGVALALPSLRGALTGTLDIAGGGGSPLALVSSLAGTGQASLADLRVSAADPAALPKVFAAVENDEVAVDGESVVRAYDADAQGALDAGTRRFRLALAGGALHFDEAEAPPSAGPVATTLDAALDLRNQRLDVTATQTLRAVPKGWSGPLPSLAVVWSGPLGAPKRRVEAADFLNAVAARALARETARVEAYEFDIRERAFFNARLQSETRRDEDRKRAEDDARKAEAARLAAARQKAEEAKAEAAKAAAVKAASAKAAAERAAQSAPPPARSPEAAPPGADADRFQPSAPGAPVDPSAAGRY